MTAYAGSSPERPRDLTRPDLPLPEPGRGDAPPPLRPPVPPAPGAADRASSSGGGRNWHRMHYPVGAFLAAYGVTGLVTGLIGWSGRREELAGYVGSGPATPGLAAVKLVELLLLALTVAGLVRRKDVWFLPVLTGWLAGFAVFAVLDVVKGKWLSLLEHVVFLGGFGLLLFVSYGLSVKARVGRAAAAAPAASGPAAPGAAPPSGPEKPLTRTQELALAALNRWQQRGASLTSSSSSGPPGSPSPSGAPRPAAPAASGAGSAPPKVPAPAPPSGDETVVDVEPPEPQAPEPDASKPESEPADESLETVVDVEPPKSVPPAPGPGPGPVDEAYETVVDAELPARSPGNTVAPAKPTAPQRLPGSPSADGTEEKSEDVSAEESEDDESSVRAAAEKADGKAGESERRPADKPAGRAGQKPSARRRRDASRQATAPLPLPGKPAAKDRDDGSENATVEEPEDAGPTSDG